MTESPFSTKSLKFDRELSTIELIWKTWDEGFVSMIPSNYITELHPKFMYPVGVSVFVLIAAAFSALFYYSYNDAIHTTFLAPFSDSSPGQVCTALTEPNSGVYLATQNGYWENDPSFEYDLAAYAVDLTGFEVSTANYGKYMDVVYSKLQYFGSLAANQSLGDNLLIWTSLAFSFDDQSSFTQRFYLTGDALVVFDRAKTGGSFSSVVGDCNASSSAYYSSADGQLTADYGYQAFVSNPLCNGSVTPTLMGYLPAIDGDVFSFSISSTPLLLALAVNTGVLGLDDLVEIDALRTQGRYQNTSYNISGYYDTRYAGMHPPISCLFGGDIYQPFCVLLLNSNMFGLPFFTDAGQSNTYPLPCNCSTLNGEELTDRYANCNLFRLISGYIFYPANSIDPLIELVLKFNYSFATINTQVFNASYTASYWGRASPAREELNAPLAREAAYDFCKVDSFGSCSLLTFSSFDNPQFDFSVSQDYYQLLNGACRDSISTSQADWDALISDPFASLQKQYKSCSSTVKSAVIDVTGLTIGNLGVIIPLAVLVVMGLLSLYQFILGISIPKQYDLADRNRALEAFAVALLYARDKGRKKGKGNADVSALRQIVADLTATADEMEEADTLYASEKDVGGVNWSNLARHVLPDCLHNVCFKKQGRAKSVNSPDAAAAMEGNPMNTEMVSSSPLSSLPAGCIVLNDGGSSGGTSVISGKRSFAEGSKATVTLEDALSYVDTLIKAFRDILKSHPADPRTSPDFWPLVGRTTLLRYMIVKTQFTFSRSNSALRRFELMENSLIEKDLEGGGSEELKFYRKLYILMAYHGSAYLNINAAEIELQHSSRIAYYVGDECLTLGDVKVKIQELS